jgi:hypothetical protein
VSIEAWPAFAITAIGWAPAVGLTIPDRQAILRVLEDCPESLAELRGVLLREHEWRMREGLA